VENASLTAYIAVLAQGVGARTLPAETFSLGGYLASGCPISGARLGSVAEAVIELVLAAVPETAKVLVTDLDDVLWSGVVAEDGLQNIAFGPEGAGYRHFLYQSLLLKLKNEGAVLAAVSAAGGDTSAAAEALAGMIGLKGRGQRHTVRIAGGTFIVIDESYNASPVSMNAAFEVLGRMHPEGGGRRIAVLGDMLELGDESEAKHAALVESLIAQKINLVFTAGQYMGALWDVLPKAMRGYNAPSAMQLLPKVSAMIRTGDVVVVKGSHGSNTGPIVEALLDLGHSPDPAPDSCGADPDNHKPAVNG